MSDATPRRFRYLAAGSDGGTVRGWEEAHDEAEAVDALIARGLTPISVRPARVRSRTRSLTSAELAPACRCMATLATAGVSADRMLVGGIDVSQGRVRALLREVRVGVREGRTMAQALRGTNVGLPPLFLDMLQAGEEGGRLGPTLVEIADQLDFETRTRAELRAALTYPAVLGVVGAVSLGVVLFVVIPRFADLFVGVDQEVPTSAAFLMSVSEAMASGWHILVVGGAIAVSIGSMWWNRVGRVRAGALLERLPVIGPIRSFLSTGRICRSISSLLSTGVPLPRAMAVAARASGSEQAADRLSRAAVRVEGGQGVAESFQAENVVAPVAAQLIAVGERGGELAEMFGKAAALASENGVRRLRALITVLEPLMIVVFGGVIALVAMSLLRAIYSMQPGL